MSAASGLGRTARCSRSARLRYGTGLLLCGCCLLPVSPPGAKVAIADSGSGLRSVDEARDAKQNPLSALRSVYFQNSYGHEPNGAVDIFSIQPVWPFRLGEDWRLITYTIVPFGTVQSPVPGGGRISGLGNVLFNGFIRPNSEGPVSWGIGPALQLPTRTDPLLGSSSVSIGPTAVVYAKSGAVSAGAVVQNLWSLGSSGPDSVNELGIQYILGYDLPDGWFLESNATVSADWLAAPGDRWLVPVGGGIGKVFQIGHGPWFYSASVQGFYNAYRPNGAPTWEAVAQFQIIFSLPD